MKRKSIVWQLSKKGMTQEDMRAAAILARTLCDLDKKAFPGNPIKRVVLDPRPLARNLACYKKLDTDGPARYGIFVKRLAKRLAKIMASNNLFVSKGRKWRVRKLQVIELDIEGACLMVAAHEIRHRMQVEGKVAQFSATYAKKFFLKWYSANPTNKSLLALVLKFCGHLFIFEKRRFQKARRPKEFIAKKLCRMEFDAKVIEYFLINKLYMSRRVNFEQIVKIIKMEPPEI